MTDAKLVERYERIRKEFGPSFAPDFGGYMMQRDLDGIVISLEPPQDGLGPGQRTEVLLTAYLREGTPEELQEKLSSLIEKRNILRGSVLTYGRSCRVADAPGPPRKMSYSGTLRDFDDGIEYVYELPTQDELQLARIVMDFDSI